MKNQYNKGRFRSYEYGKIPPYLQKIGNKKWRRTAKTEINNHFIEATGTETKVQIPKHFLKRNQCIKVKITYLGYKSVKTSSYVSYKSIKALNDSIKRNNVINIVFL